MGKITSALLYLPETVRGKVQWPPLGTAQVIHRGVTQLCLDLEFINIQTYSNEEVLLILLLKCFINITTP